MEYQMIIGGEAVKSENYFDVNDPATGELVLSLIHISEPTRRYAISYAVFCLELKVGCENLNLTYMIIHAKIK